MLASALKTNASAAIWRIIGKIGLAGACAQKEGKEAYKKEASHGLHPFADYQYLPRAA